MTQDGILICDLCGFEGRQGNYSGSVYVWSRQGLADACPRCTEDIVKARMRSL